MAKGDLIFLDTETTSLRRPWMTAPKAVWDIGGVRWAGGDPASRTEFQFFVTVPGEALADADPFALNIGGYFERFPKHLSHDGAPGVIPRGNKMSPAGAARWLTHWMHGATIVGNLPSFDEESLSALCYGNGHRLDAHHHVIDLFAMTQGYLLGAGDSWDTIVAMNSDALSEAVGAQPPTDEERHTALGDALWDERWYKALRGL